MKWPFWIQAMDDHSIIPWHSFFGNHWNSHFSNFFPLMRTLIQSFIILLTKHIALRNFICSGSDFGMLQVFAYLFLVLFDRSHGGTGDVRFWVSSRCTELLHSYHMNHKVLVGIFREKLFTFYSGWEAQKVGSLECFPRFGSIALYQLIFVLGTLTLFERKMNWIFFNSQLKMKLRLSEVFASE